MLVQPAAFLVKVGSPVIVQTTSAASRSQHVMTMMLLLKHFVESHSILKIVSSHVGHQKIAQLERHAFLSHRVKPPRWIILLNLSIAEQLLRRHLCHVLTHAHRAATQSVHQTNSASPKLLAKNVNHITAVQV